MEYHICSYIKKYVLEYGDIPEGYNIHHIDINRKNNELKNLVAIPIELHKKYHENEKYMNMCFRQGNYTGFVYHSDKLIELYYIIMEYKHKLGGCH